MTTNATTALPDFEKIWNFNKPAQTEAEFKQILPLATKSEDLDYKLQLLTQIARTQGLQRNFEEAHKTLDGVESLISKATPVAEIRYNLERGRVFNSSKKKEMALPLFKKSFDLAVAHKEDNLAVDAAHMVAIAETDATKIMEWNLKALKLSEDSKNQKTQDWQGSLYNNIGWTYHDSGKFTEALDMFTKALAYRQKKGEASSIRIAQWCVARAYRSLNKLDESLQLQKSLEDEFNKLPDKDGYVFEELGELYLLKKNNDKAKKYFALAYHEFSKDEGFKANDAKRLARLKELGQVK